MTYLSIYPIFRDSVGTDHFAVTYSSEIQAFALDLSRMYIKWAEANDVAIEVIEETILYFPDTKPEQLASENGVHAYFCSGIWHLALVLVSLEKQSGLPEKLSCFYDWRYQRRDASYRNCVLPSTENIKCVREYVLDIPVRVGCGGGTYTTDAYYLYDDDIIKVDYNALENGGIEPFLTSFC